MKAATYVLPVPLDRPPAGVFVQWDERIEALHDALDGVPLGPYDERFLDWMCSWDDPTARTFVSLIMRARATAVLNVIPASNISTEAST